MCLALGWVAGVLFGCAGGASTPRIGQVGAPPPCAHAGDWDAAKAYANDVLVEARTRRKMLELGVNDAMAPMAKKRWESCGLSRASDTIYQNLEMICPDRDVPISELRAMAFTEFVACDTRMPG